MCSCVVHYCLEYLQFPLSFQKVSSFGSKFETFPSDKLQFDIFFGLKLHFSFKMSLLDKLYENYNTLNDSVLSGAKEIGKVIIVLIQ